VEDFGGFLASEVFDHVWENVAIIDNDFKVKNLRGSALAVSFAARAAGDKWAGDGAPSLPFRVWLRLGFARALCRGHSNGCFNPSNITIQVMTAQSCDMESLSYGV
jgi:hypothetical protein